MDSDGSSSDKEGERELDKKANEAEDVLVVANSSSLNEDARQEEGGVPVVTVAEQGQDVVQEGEDAALPSLFEQLEAVEGDPKSLRREAFVRPVSREEGPGLVRASILNPTRTPPVGPLSRPSSARPPSAGGAITRPSSSSRRPTSAADSEVSALSGSDRGGGDQGAADSGSDEDEDDGGDEAPEEVAVNSRGSSRSSRRAAVDSTFDVELAMKRRVKKTSVELPPIRSNCRRIQQIVFKPKVFKHIVDECVGGVYGKPSRPDLELLEVSFAQEDDDDEAAETVRLVYNSSREAYIHSPMIEDLIIEKLLENDRNLGVVKYSAVITHKEPIITMCPAVMRKWRKFVSIYIVPLLKDANRVKLALRRLLQYRHKLNPERILRREIEVYSPEDVDHEADRDEDEKKRLRKQQAASKRSTKMAKPGAPLVRENAGGGGGGARNTTVRK